jgi:hypothetical protein
MAKSNFGTVRFCDVVSVIRFTLFQRRLCKTMFTPKMTSISLGLLLVICSNLRASDFFLTIAGGYAPDGNQASLEANVLFMQRVLTETQLSARPHRIYFADGFDAGHDLQCVSTETSLDSPAMAALKQIFRISNEKLFYRNHQVPNISGSLRASEIREGLMQLQSQMKAGDRLIIYVTAHGSAGGARESKNTSISCWGNKPLRMTEFSGWLDELPPGVQVVSVMAQCYCGGFADTIFRQGDPELGLSENVRCGFFAQRHDLPAAGCRPEIENDEEYSSYFWGAFVGRSRTGKPATNIDCNNDKMVSFAEAHAYAVLASETVDIPLCTSEALLRRYSRIGGYDSNRSDEEPNYEIDEFGSEKKWNYLTGTIYEVAARGRPEETRMVIGLAEKLGLALTSEVVEVTEGYQKIREQIRNSRGAAFRRGRGSGSRRRMQSTVVENWPELQDPSNWVRAEVLSPSNEAQFLTELQALPGYEDFNRSTEERAKSRQTSLTLELKEVKFRRLIHQLENIVLAQNLTLAAQPDVVERYQQILAAEAGHFSKR